MYIILTLLLPILSLAGTVDKEFKCETKNSNKMIRLEYSESSTKLPCVVVVSRAGVEETSWYFDSKLSNCQYKYIEVLMKYTRDGYKCKESKHE